MPATSIDRRNGDCYVAGSRVTLASVAYEYKDGASAETIRQNFPVLTTGQIESAIQCYIDNQFEVERYLLEHEAAWSALAASAKPVDPVLHERLQRARAFNRNQV